MIEVAAPTVQFQLMVQTAQHKYTLTAYDLLVTQNLCHISKCDIFRMPIQDLQELSFLFENINVNTSFKLPRGQRLLSYLRFCILVKVCQCVCICQCIFQVLERFLLFFPPCEYLTLFGEPPQRLRYCRQIRNKP